jgi:hypothetical protein
MGRITGGGDGIDIIGGGGGGCFMMTGGQECLGVNWGVPGCKGYRSGSDGGTASADGIYGMFGKEGLRRRDWGNGSMTECNR